MKMLVAAAIKAGDTVVLELEGHREEAVIRAVHSSTPKAGRITWDTSIGDVVGISAIRRFQVVGL